jgi:hypothetical protein
VVQRQDAQAADVALAQLQAVRAEDVQRVLRQHVLGGHPVALRYVQAPRTLAGSAP